MNLIHLKYKKYMTVEILHIDSILSAHIRQHFYSTGRSDVKIYIEEKDGIFKSYSKNNLTPESFKLLFNILGWEKELFDELERRELEHKTK